MAETMSDFALVDNDRVGGSMLTVSRARHVSELSYLPRVNGKRDNYALRSPQWSCGLFQLRFREQGASASRQEHAAAYVLLSATLSLTRAWPKRQSIACLCLFPDLNLPDDITTSERSMLFARDLLLIKSCQITSMLVDNQPLHLSRYERVLTLDWLEIFSERRQRFPHNSYHLRS
jgi:hypothetical protein